MKRLLVTSTDVMMLQFLVPHVYNLKGNGFNVEVVCSDVEGHIEELKDIFKDDIPFTIVNLKRNPFSLSNIEGFCQLKHLIQNGNYDVIWTNEPVMGVMTRLATITICKEKRPKLLYVAHGFHFFKGAAMKNWIIFYPIEKILSYITDEIITINKEDHLLASRELHCKKVMYFPGIGIETSKFFKEFDEDTLLNKRKELGLKNDETVLLSVGELEKRKNHATTIEALSRVNHDKIKLLICGVGTQKKALEEQIEKLNLQKNVFLLGYRYDINELSHISDAFVFATYQEGLSVALMEAMAVGVPCIISRIRGNVDLIEHDKGLFFNPKDVNSMIEAINLFLRKRDVLGNAVIYNKKKIREFDIEKVKQLMLNEILQLTKE